MKQIENLLRSLGIGRRYAGYAFVCRALEMILEDENRLRNVKQSLLIPLAAEFHCSWTSIERDIRTITSRAWKVRPDMLRSMAGYPLHYTPTENEFLEILSGHLLRQSDGAAPQSPEYPNND